MATPPRMRARVRVFGSKMVDFLGLQVDFFSSTANNETFSTHTVYFKKHTVRRDDPTTPSGLTLFSVGWPPYCSRSQVEAVFSRAGYVTDAYVQENPGQLVKKAEGGGEGGRVAYVVFSQPEEVDRALVLCAGGDRIRCDIGSTGVGKWCEGYASTRPKPTSLDAAAKLVVGQYDKNTADQQKVRKRLSEPDSDGWVTVTSKRPQSSGQQNQRKKKKEKKLTNFYQFQQRESKREAVAELRRKFLKDKERVAQLRARRKFRPF